MIGLNGNYAQWEVGTYENQFIKQDAVWKIKAVHYYPGMATDYDGAGPGTRNLRLQ